VKVRGKYISLYSRIVAYLQGKMSANDRYDLEKESQTDLFLNEALEGFDLLKADDVLFDILQLEHQFENRKSGAVELLLRVAAVVVLLLGLGVVAYIVFDNDLSTQKLASTEFDKKDRIEKVVNVPESGSIQDNGADINIKEEKSVELNVVSDNVDFELKEDDVVISNNKIIDNVATIEPGNDEEYEVMSEELLVVESFSGNDSDVEIDAESVLSIEPSSASVSNNEVALYSEGVSDNEAPLQSRVAKSKLASSKKGAQYTMVAEKPVGERNINIVFDEKAEPFIPQIGVEAFVRYLYDSISYSTDSYLIVEFSFEMGEDNKPVNYTFTANADKHLLDNLIQLVEKGSEWKLNPSSDTSGKRVKFIVEFY